MGRPFSRAPLPALGREQLLGHRVVDDADLDAPSISSAIDTQKSARPCAKLVVPSSGSMIQRQRAGAARPARAAPSSPRTSCDGNRAR